MSGAQRAVLGFVTPLLKDLDKLKSWIGSNCETVTVTGNDLAMYWSMMNMGSSVMPASMEVCRSSSNSVREMATCAGLSLSDWR